MALAENIKNLRKQKGWSQSELAEKIGSHLSHINRLETGKYQPSLDVLKKLASVLEVSLDTLVSDEYISLEQIKNQDKTLLERVKLIDSLDSEDRQALLRIIDSMLTKQKILHLLTSKSQDLELIAK